MLTVLNKTPTAEDLPEESRPYQPHGACAEIFKSRDDELLCSGPAGCVAGETRILDPITGNTPSIEEIYRSGKRPMVQTMIGPVLAELPFIKGVAPLFKITTKSGKTFVVTNDHLLFSLDGWKKVAFFSVGEPILVSSSCHPQTSVDTCQQEFLRDARHSFDRVPDCQDRYLTDRHPCGERPLPDRASGRSFSPSRSYALERIHACSPAGDPASRSGYSPSCLSSSRHATQDFYFLDKTGHAQHNQFDDRSENDECAFFWHRFSDTSRTRTPQTSPALREALDWHSKRRRDHMTVLSHAFSACAKPDCASGQPHRRSFLSNALRETMQQCDLVARQSNAYTPSRLSPGKFDYKGLPQNSKWDSIQSIEFDRVDIYFDLHVPVAEHYLAEGAWHHNTGKSIASLSKIFMMAEKHAGARLLICRKTRESMTQSTLVTWEDKVVPEGHPCLVGPSRNERKEYRFSNGSVVVVAGLRQASRDNTQNIMSTDYDAIYVPEAIELSEEEWERLTTRLRNGKMPYQQLLADTNPAAPTHWLKKRCDRGQTKMLHSRHTDNPLLYDRVNKKWTDFGEKYIKKLQSLTGARKKRLCDGLWASPEGSVYENWEPAIHVIDSFPIPKDWRRFLSIDFGYNVAFVCQWWTIDPDGRLYLYREYVKVHRLVEDHGKIIKEIMDKDKDKIESIVCDTDAEGRATLEKYLERNTVGARKDVEVGIQLVDSRFKVQGDGKPRIFLFNDALMFRDDEMEDAKLPIGLIEELDGYIFDISDPKKPTKDTPLKLNDHACDCLRYVSMHVETGRWVPPGDLKPPPEQKEKSPVDWRSGNIGWRKRGINWRLMEDV